MWSISANPQPTWKGTQALSQPIFTRPFLHYKKIITPFYRWGYWDCCCYVTSVVSDSVTPQTAAHQAPVCGILQARILRWVAISFSSVGKLKVKVKLLSRVWLFLTPWTVVYQAPPSKGFPRQEYRSGLPLPSPKLRLKKIKYLLDTLLNCSTFVSFIFTSGSVIFYNQPKQEGFSLTVLHLHKRQWHPTPVLLPGKSHGWRSLVGCSPWGR